MTVSELRKIKGIGKSKVEMLNKANIYSIEQIANSTPEILTKIDGVGEKSAIKWISSARELLGKELKQNKVITERPLEVASKTGTMIKPELSSSSILFEIQSNVKNIFLRMGNFENRLKVLERELKSHSDESLAAEISQDQFLRILNSVYNSIDKKFEEFVPISLLTKKIKDYIPWSTEKIHSELYKLFMNYKIDLQPGKNYEGPPLMQDGKKFVWFKLI